MIFGRFCFELMILSPNLARKSLLQKVQFRFLFMGVTSNHV